MNSMSQNVPECPKYDDAKADAVTTPVVAAATPAATPETDRPLPPNQQAAIALLLTGAHTGDVATAVGIDRRTLYRWRYQDPQFIRELRRQRAQAIDNANDRLRHLLTTALSALELQVNDPYAPTSHRAAKTLLALARVGQPATRRPVSAPRSRTAPGITPTATNSSITPVA